MTVSADEVVVAHLWDDYERVRTRALRTAQRHRDLLADAAEALRRGDTHITAEFIDRVVDGLTAEVEWLRAQQ